MPKPAPLVMKKGLALPASLTEGVSMQASPRELPPAAAASEVALSSVVRTATDELVPLSFKVSKHFNRAFRQVALDDELKLNELLFAAFEAYRRQRKNS
ncbi:hypothetical protein [Scleromatobacter humisilvae]|uniref:Uncharacterized protein n=1 Tax=Scleromatobacter humisilvae TaxID=2897159 RepID=A0A9X1YMZ1_9BURK|nr:hypothetical protein [Scleromatobacter humisilvae]MCK9687352.1 hypothetical protein [Scleromatobacter humisilvae]